MSASLLVDLYNTCFQAPTIIGTPVLSGALVAPCSGAVVGMSVDMLNANTFTNMQVTGFSASGQLRVAVQTSDSDVSGNYTDPTSGLAAFPTNFQSGGILWVNSGGAGGGTFQGFQSGSAIASGFSVSAGFQRPGRYARALILSGDFGAGPLVVNFIANLKTTGSGAGFTYSPSSGVVSV